ncbi:MAG TPA: isoprenylcysteine carboxylmethyltransferase family protein [Longimicrobiaceae bacterium]|jgi:protein-S-isoprenylcysteine O-methyltransferase Ste14|nr:isoprenylcysteine carboxylmethyltransferase family protein [Longimicrobiaceae bacterium]
MLVPPPLLFALPLIAGIFLHRRIPLLHAPASVTKVLGWIGGMLILTGALHVSSSVALFLRSGTTIIPHGRPSALVERGAYRWTRNPMYVGLTLIYLGVSALTSAVWALFLLPLPLTVIDRRVIPTEEGQLERSFGPAYAAYRQRVRRWL